MGHASIETTESYLHVSKNGITAAKSPLESKLASKEIAADDRNEKTDNVTLRLFVG
jgi:hypothetical protein